MNASSARRLLSIVLAVCAALAQANDAFSQTAPYCAALQKVAALASAKDRFSSITGAAREGSFSETTLPLGGWKDCALYGPTTYTCDSQDAADADQAEKLQAKLVDDILSCFAGAWFHVVDRSSPTYAVLHSAKGAASITLSVDEAGNKQFVVRLTLFIRRS